VHAEAACRRYYDDIGGDHEIGFRCAYEPR